MAYAIDNQYGVCYIDCNKRHDVCHTYVLTYVIRSVPKIGGAGKVILE